MAANGTMKYPYVDMHCDTLLRTLRTGSSETLYDGEGMQSIKQMKDASQLAQFFAVFFPPREVPEGRKRPFELPEDEEFYALMKQYLREEVAKHSDIIAIAKNAQEIQKNAEAGLMSAVLSIEDGRIVQGSMERLKALREDGVCAISLTWNFANCFGVPNSKDPEIMGTGLTAFGKEAIGVMNDLGILVDVSHLSDGGFWDVVSLTKKPFVATHSNCRELSPHTRNLTDEMIKALAEKGGVSGLNFGPEFLSKDTTNKVTTIELLSEHVMHMLKVGGEDFPALGTDFDGIGGTFEVGHPTQMDALYDALSKKGMTASQLEKFASKNVLRVMKDSIA